MESYLISDIYDLVTPDGKILSFERKGKRHAVATVSIDHISPAFRGFQIPQDQVFFNIKSTLAQIGMDAIGRSYELDKERKRANILLDIYARSTMSEAMLDFLGIGCYIGKLFAADETRKVRNPDYLHRMFNRIDRQGRPLLYLGNPNASNELTLEKIDGYTVAYLQLLEGTITYDSNSNGFLPTLGKALLNPNLKVRQILQLNQQWNFQAERK
ncbi:MAG: hypothetical protein FJZ57_02110, partial [Chlamydiae bacterium]|nr:hypothetical protein [Chlamydiota bacterium]